MAGHILSTRHACINCFSCCLYFFISVHGKATLFTRGLLLDVIFYVSLRCLSPFQIFVLTLRRFSVISRRIMDEDDDDLSEAETLRSVPHEVRDWLTMTFTRSLTNMKRSQDRLHFRSVANAIRAGIVVDRCARCETVTFKHAQAVDSTARRRFAVCLLIDAHSLAFLQQQQRKISILVSIEYR